MKLVRFEQAGAVHFGLLRRDHVVSLSHPDRPASARISSVEDVIAGGGARMAALLADDERRVLAPRYALSQVRLLAPITAPPNNVFCVGLNYRDHVAEGGRTPMAIEVPHFFTKTANTITGPVGPVPYWRNVTQALDYEIELAVVLGAGGRDIKRADAMDHVLGYCVANDISARDLQRRHGQWFKGKSLDGSLPLGPCIVTSDEIVDPSALELVLSVNGEVRQRAVVAQMMFDIPTLIEQLSAGLTLSAGDIILTGTPAGVGFAMNPPRFLADGDEVVCTIDGIGSLRNQIVAMP